MVKYDGFFLRLKYFTFSFALIATSHVEMSTFFSMAKPNIIPDIVSFSHPETQRVFVDANDSTTNKYSLFHFVPS